MNYFLPERVSVESCSKFMIALFDNVSCNMEPHIDQMNLIYDFNGMSRKNLSLGIGKALVKVSGVSKNCLSHFCF